MTNQMKPPNPRVPRAQPPAVMKSARPRPVKCSQVRGLAFCYSLTSLCRYTLRALADSRLLADGGVVLLDRLIEAGLRILVLEDNPVDRVLPRVLELAVVGRSDQRPGVGHV